MRLNTFSPVGDGNFSTFDITVETISHKDGQYGDVIEYQRYDEQANERQVSHKSLSSSRTVHSSNIKHIIITTCAVGVYCRNTTKDIYLYVFIYA